MDHDELPPELAERVRRFQEEATKPISPGDPRRHHSIPRWYLNRFATPDERIAIVGLHDRKSSTVTGTENAAVIKDFYTVMDKQGRPTVAVEKLLAMADEAACQPLERLAYGVLFPPTAKDRADLAIWLALLMVRDTHTRRLMEVMGDHIAKLSTAMVTDEESARAFIEQGGKSASPEEIEAILYFASHQDDWEVLPPQNNLVKEMLGLAQVIVPYLYHRLWMVVRFPDHGLVTTDRPLVVSGSPRIGAGGVATADEIRMPLDRNHGLILHLNERFGDCVIDAPPALTIDRMNQWAVNEAYDEIYCHPDDVGRLERIKLPPARPLVHISSPFPADVTDGANAPPQRRRHKRFRSP